MHARYSWSRSRLAITLSREIYQEDLKGINVDQENHVRYPLTLQFNMSKDMCLNSKEEKKIMRKVTYVFATGSLMYMMVCIGLKVSFAIGIASGFLSISKKRLLYKIWISTRYFVEFFEVLLR